MIPELLQHGGLSFERLQSFCLVAQAGGVTRAALGDPTRQSLYSRQIKELEEFFGTELIRRTGRGISLTETGHRLHAMARETFTALADFKSDCTSQSVEVVIGTGDSFIQWLFLPRLADLRARLPRIRLKFLNLPTAEAMKRLADGLIDYALVRQEVVHHPLKSIPLGTLSYSLFVPSNLSLKSARSGIKFLDNLPLATLEGGGDFRSALASAAQKAAIRLNIQVECSSFPLAARAVAQDAVAAILPSIAAPELKASKATEIPLKFLRALDRKYCLASNPRTLAIRPSLQPVAAVLAHHARL